VKKKGNGDNTTVCSDPGKVDTGTVPFDNAYSCKVPPYPMWKSGDKCGAYVYSADQQKTADSNGIVKCNYTQNCTYTDANNDPHNETCVCGENADGQGYCPIPVSYVSQYSDYIKAVYSTDTKCHTLHRFKCPVVTQNSDIAANENKFWQQGAGLHDAVKCAKATFHSLSLIALFALFALLI